MKSFRTNGIVIKRFNFGEADRILTILTDRLGKVSAMAKGVRKIKSKMAGSLEPYMLVDLQLHEGKTFYIVTAAAITEVFKNIHSDIKKTAQAYFVGELIDKFLAENQKAEVIFEISREVLRKIDSYQNSHCEELVTKQSIKKDCRASSPFCKKGWMARNDRQDNFLISAYELKIIEAAGFKPELYSCLHCKEKLSAGANFWDHIEGGVICRTCEQKFHHGTEISDEAIKALRFIEQNDFSKIDKLKLNRNIEREVDKILSEYIKNVLERDLKSRKFLNQISK